MKLKIAIRLVVILGLVASYQIGKSQGAKIGEQEAIAKINAFLERNLGAICLSIGFKQ